MQVCFVCVTGMANKTIKSTKNYHSEICIPLESNITYLSTCPNKGSFPIVNKCRIYLLCASKGAIPKPTCCTEGHHFDHLLRRCIGTEDANCKSSYNIVVLLFSYNYKLWCGQILTFWFNSKSRADICSKDGLRIADPMTQNGFLQCNNLEIPLPVPCPKPRSQYYSVENVYHKNGQRLLTEFKT